MLFFSWCFLEQIYKNSKNLLKLENVFNIITYLIIFFVIVAGNNWNCNYLGLNYSPMKENELLKFFC